MEVELGGVRAGKRFSLFVSNEDMDITRIKKSRESSGLLIDEVIETVKHKIKKQEGGLLGELVKQKKRQNGGFLPLLLPLLFSSSVRKGAMRAGKGYNNMDDMDKIFSSAPSFK